MSAGEGEQSSNKELFPTYFSTGLTEKRNNHIVKIVGMQAPFIRRGKLPLIIISQRHNNFKDHGKMVRIVLFESIVIIRIAGIWIR